MHLDDGRFHEHGRYWSSLADVHTTADLVASSSDYDHLLFYAHGGLNSPKDSARRIAAMKETFKDNRVYPYLFMYDTGVMIAYLLDATERVAPTHRIVSCSLLAPASSV